MSALGARDGEYQRRGGFLNLHMTQAHTTHTDSHAHTHTLFPHFDHQISVYVSKLNYSDMNQDLSSPLIHFNGNPPPTLFAGINPLAPWPRDIHPLLPFEPAERREKHI